MSEALLDASALLALLNAEPGADEVAEAVASGAAISAVNLAEVVAKLAEAGLEETEIREALDPLSLEVVPFDAAQALGAGMLRRATRRLGLSLGDRACLSLAARLRLPVLTTDKAWRKLDLDVQLRLVRGGLR